MPLPVRQPPSTPLEELRGLLGQRLDLDAGAQVRVHQLLGVLRQQALPALGDRLARATEPAAAKRFLLGLTARFDWPEWVPWIHQALVHEPDLGVFDDGCAALGRLALPSARTALKRLAEQRGDADRQTILRRELGPGEAQPLAFHLNRVLEGEGNPRLAQQGARGLAACADPSAAGTLREALGTADSLAFRILLRILADLPGEAPGPLVVDLAWSTLAELRDQESLEALAQRLQAVPRAEARPLLARAAADLEAAGALPGADPLRRALQAPQPEPPGPWLEALRAEARGPLAAFLLEAAGTLLEGKVARFGVTVAEAGAAASQATARLGAHLDHLCDGLVRLALEGRLSRAGLARDLRGPFTAPGCPPCLDRAFSRLVDAGDPEGLGLVLALADHRRRSACLDVLGAREEDALGPFFQQATQDPIVEVGLRAMHHFARLPSSFPTTEALFRSGQPDGIRLALRIFTETAPAAAAGLLTDFLREESRDDFLLEAVQALGAIRDPASAPALLALLHDGKPARLQEALVAALAGLATPEAGLGLLDRSPHLKLPQVLIVALEGALAAFPGFAQPLPVDRLPEVERLILRCCDDREGEGQRLRAILATQHLFAFDQGLYARLKDTFGDFLFELRTRTDWDREANDRVAAVVKELGRRSASLGEIAAKEARVHALARAVPPAGAGRTPALLALREALQDPEFILRSEAAEALAAFVAAELRREDQDWSGLARLCEIGGLTRRLELAGPLREVLDHAPGLGLRSAAREGLLALGLTEADLAHRPPVRTLLLLDPSAFFRRRLASALGPEREVREAPDRRAAEALLADHPVDLLVSERTDAEGDLGPWLKAQWEARRCRQVLLSTSDREDLEEGPWLLGTLRKPYPAEALLRALEP